MIAITATMNRNGDPDTFAHEKGAYFALKDAAQAARVPFAEGTEADGLPEGYLGIVVRCGWPGMYATLMHALIERDGDRYHDCYGLSEIGPAERVCIGDTAPFFCNLDEVDDMLAREGTQ